MPSYNKGMFMGCIVRPTELTRIPGDAVVLKNALAMNEKYTNKDGEKCEKTCFIEFEIWNKQAEVMNEYSDKGDTIFIEGNFKQEKWIAPGGENRSKLVLRVFKFVFIKKVGDHLQQEERQEDRDMSGTVPF